jgi:ElaB/YqjD/DUF883 family membrane-anchored ribosome-binding protein
MTQQFELKSKWNDLKDRISEQWSQVSADELNHVGHNPQKLIAYLENRTGQARDEIERVLTGLDDQAASLYNRASNVAKDYMSGASEATKEKAQEVWKMAEQRGAEAKEMVRNRPGESIAVAFGAGIVAGVILGLVGRSR